MNTPPNRQPYSSHHLDRQHPDPRHQPATMTTGKQWTAAGLFGVLEWIASFVFSLALALLAFGLAGNPETSEAGNQLAGFVSGAGHNLPYVVISIVVTALIYWFLVFGKPRWNTLAMQFVAGLCAAFAVNLLNIGVFQLPVISGYVQDPAFMTEIVFSLLLSAFLRTLVAAPIAALIVGLIFRRSWRQSQRPGRQR